MNRVSKKELVRRKLIREGEIGNHWAIDQRLTTRLGAVIHQLRQTGMDIQTVMVPGSKDCVYTYHSKPKPRVEYVEVDGVMHAKLVPAV